MELSKRLTAVAGLVTEGASVADIGTDHGYIPIYLIEQNLSPKVIAMDINKGPLERARIHIAGYGMSDRIETRLSDGLAAVKPKEVEEMIVAGMGGGLVIHILEEGKQIVSTLKGCILQPQSEIQKVREYLVEHGFRFEAEDMVEEDGKYYPMMRLIGPGAEQKTGSCDAGSSGNAGINVGTAESWSQVEYAFGKLLLQRHDPVLREFLLKEKAQYAQVRRTVSDKMAEDGRGRVQEIDAYLALIGEALAYDGM